MHDIARLLASNSAHDKIVSLPATSSAREKFHHICPQGKIMPFTPSFSYTAVCKRTSSIDIIDTHF
jgi:hypothetical protein